MMVSPAPSPCGDLSSLCAVWYAPGEPGTSWPFLAGTKSGRLMRAIAIRFVVRRAAAAQSDAVAHLARLAICPFDRNAPADPQRAVRGHGDFLREIWFHHLAINGIRQGSRGTAL